MLTLHWLPEWIEKALYRPSSRWNTQIVERTKQGVETYDEIRFKSCLPQGDALCPRLFMLSTNPVLWKSKATKAYKLSNSIDMQVTHPLFKEDLSKI